jgi:hypothetical protein
MKRRVVPVVLSLVLTLFFRFIFLLFRNPLKLKIIIKALSQTLKTIQRLKTSFWNLKRARAPIYWTETLGRLEKNKCIFDSKVKIIPLKLILL